MSQAERVGTNPATECLRAASCPSPEDDLRCLLGRSQDLTPDRVVELVCADQIRRWRDGQRVPAETYLALHPVLEPGSDAELEVVFGEFALREQEGESPCVPEYQRRFPEFGDRLRQMFEVHRLTESA